MRWEPVELEIAGPRVVVDTAKGTPVWALARLKELAEEHPGGYRLALLVGRHTLALGPEYNVAPSPELEAALSEFGRVEVVRG